MRVYLCGPINGCSDTECIDWRQSFKSHPSIECIDPMQRDYRGREHECIDEIVEGDKDDILSCEKLVYMHFKPSIGSSMEVFFAYQNGMDVVVIDKSQKPLSPWLVYHSTAIVSSEKEAVDALIGPHASA